MGNHYYTRKGVAAHFTNGRATNLRDARKLQLLPSVTSVLDILNKEALNNWREEQVAKAAYDCLRIDDETCEDYVAKVLKAARQRPIDAATKGSDIHDAMECWFSGRRVPSEHTANVEAVQAELEKLFPNVGDWVSEKSFAHPLGFGGRVDLHSPSTGIVVDFKSKDGDFLDGKRLGYDQVNQLAAYQVGLGLPQSAGAAIFVSRTHPGAVASHLWDTQEMIEGWQVFEAALTCWKRIKKYDGAYREEA